MNILNVGGGSRNLPPEFAGWEQDLLDIDSEVKPDICCDAREMTEHLTKDYDVVYISHTLEHFYKHDVPAVLTGCLNALKIGGSIHVYVPNIKKTIEELYLKNMDIDDVWYRNAGGDPITYHDTIHGWNKAMSAGNLFYAHKCSFTPLSLCSILSITGFKEVGYREDGNNLFATGKRE